MKSVHRQVLLAMAVVAGFALAGLGVSQLVGFRAPVGPELAVEQRLMCPQCQGVRLDVCDRPICTDMRADIRRRLAAGESGDAIVGVYEATYGPGVLAAAGASNASAALPWLFVLAGLVLLASLAGSRPRLREAPVGEGADPGREAAHSPALDGALAAWREGR